MPATYEPLATTTLSSAQASVTFSSISGSYTDLVLVINDTNGTGSDALMIRLNGDTGSNYSNTRMRGDGSAASSARDSNQTSMNIAFTSTTYSTSIINLMNYANTTTNKTVIGRSSNGNVETKAGVGLWRSTAAITSITMITSNGNSFQSGSTFSLYGIKSF